MKRIKGILIAAVMACAILGAQTPQPRPEQSKAAADIPLTDEERQIIVGYGKEIDILVLKQQNAILSAANDHGVSLKTYELVDRKGDGKSLVFTPKSR